MDNKKTSLPLSTEATKVGRFTLIELLKFVAVISLLASIAIAQYQRYRVDPLTTAKSDLRNAMTVLEAYFTQKGVFPATSVELLANGFNLSKNVNLTTYKREAMAGGGQTVHGHVKHSSSPNAWHANYPKEGNNIEIR